MDPERLLRGIAMPDRAEPPLPHRCRCIVVKPEYQNVVKQMDWGTDGPILVIVKDVDQPPVMREDRCAQLVFDGPDNPLCTDCRVNHWGDPEFRMWEPDSTTGPDQ